MNNRSGRVCPVEFAGGLDNRVRRWIQNPQKILKPYIKEGMTVLDLGCGPGFFSIDIAKMVSESGRVIACDLQEGMLQKVRDKIQGTDLRERITLHKCETSKIGLTEKVDFVMTFYMVHEVPNQEGFFSEIRSLLKPNGQFLIVEPMLHVSNNAFEKTIEKAKAAGFTAGARPKVFFSKAVILTAC